MEFWVVFTVSIDGHRRRVRTDPYPPAKADRIASILRQEGATEIRMVEPATGFTIYAGNDAPIVVRA